MKKIFLLFSLVMCWACDSSSPSQQNKPTVAADTSTTTSQCLTYETPYYPPYDVNSDFLDPGMDTSLLNPILQSLADTLSWKAFIAYNWQPLENGSEPDSSLCIGQNGDNMTVWENWKEKSEVFKDDGQAPLPWGQYEQEPNICLQDSSKNPKILYRKAKVSQNKHLQVLTGFQEPDKNTLTDQNGQLTRYEIMINEVLFNFINTNKLYSKTGMQIYLKKNRNLLYLPESVRKDTIIQGYQFKKQRGSVVIKAAWKVLGKNDDESRFHISKAWVVDENQKCKLQKMALVGLHIAQKTAESQPWIWSTFEHIDNCPDSAAIDPNKKYSYYDPNCKDCPQNQPSVNKASQITRRVPIYEKAKALNTYYQNMLRAINPKSVWQYYQLVGTQWALPIPVSQQQPYTILPDRLGNTMLESYIQATSSCIGCHKNAKTVNNVASDFLFQFSNLK